MKTTAFETAFVRVPVAGFTAIDNLDWPKLSRQLQHPAFLEALYVASSSLYKEAIKLDFSRQPDEKTRRIVYPLIKYLSRYATRCTPFGLFGGFATVPIESTATKIRIADTGRLKRVVRLDMNYLCSLAQDLEKHPDVKPYLRFFPNSSLYEVNNQYRYVAYQYGEGGQRMHRLSSAEKSDYLAHVCEKAQSGVSINELIRALVADDIEAEDAHEFIESVIDAQLLVSELEPSLTGADSQVQILAVLKTISHQYPSNPLSTIVALLQQVYEDLKAIEAQEQQPSIEALSQVEQTLSKLATPFDRKVLFQIDTHLPTLSGQLNRVLINKLIAKIPTLLKLTPPREGAMADFRSRFTSKYDDEEIPLVIALDPEIGIGFPGGGDPLDTSPLVEGITAGKTAEANRTWTVQPQQAYLFQKVAEAQLTKTYQITIAEDELAALSVSLDKVVLPPTNAALFSVIRENGRESFVLNSVAGATGAMLLGRFGHTDSGVLDLLNQISEAEDQIWPDVIFADIVHLPEARTGNIIIRPQLKAYQIPYLGKASVDRDHQLPVTDLMIRVRNNQVILRSRSLNKIIVPRLANAHNYSTLDSLDIYHFLCALQEQSICPFMGVGLNGVTSMFVFVPRIVLDNLILSEAHWNCQAHHVKPLVMALKQADWPTLQAEIGRWRAQYSIPQHICLVDFDNELYVDLDNQWLAEMFVNEIKSKSTFTVKEFLFHADNAVVESAGNWHTNQFVVAFRNDSDVIHPQLRPISAAPLPAVKRKFLTGSDWLYYKIYTGIKTADRLLTDVLYPMAERFDELGWTDRFFFIRYGDPEGHIRIRFHLSHPSFLGDLIQEIHDKLMPFLENRSVTSVVNDTYNRELERYGANSIDAVETYFHVDSRAIMHFLSLIEGPEGEAFRWQFGLLLTDALLTDFNFDLKAKMEFAELQTANFGREFGYNASLKKQLDSRYKEIESCINELLSNTTGEYEFLHELNQQRQLALRPFVDLVTDLSERGALAIPMPSLLGSLIHMTTNRLFRSRQRFVEYSIYYHLHKYYRVAYGRATHGRSAFGRAAPPHKNVTPETITC